MMYELMDLLTEKFEVLFIRICTFFKIRIRFEIEQQICLKKFVYGLELIRLFAHLLAVVLLFSVQLLQI